MLNRGLGIPANFEEKLPELKDKTLKWETIYNSGSEINSSAAITYHQPMSEKQYGTIILFPGLATNTAVDPLMTSVTFWALTHKYNVINVNTFINDFLIDLTPEKAKNNTYTEFKTIIRESLNFVQPYTTGSYSLVVGHCASAMGIIDTFNDTVEQGGEIPVSSALLFAPWPKTPGDAYEANLMRLLTQGLNTQKGATDIVSQMRVAHMKFLYAMGDFRKEVQTAAFKPETMAQWNIPVTFVTAQRDKISQPERIAKYQEALAKISNNFVHLTLPNRKHSFEKLYEDTSAVVNLIKSQKAKYKGNSK